MFFFKQKTAYEMRISDWSSDVCSSDLLDPDRATTTDRKDHMRKFATRSLAVLALAGSPALAATPQDRGFWQTPTIHGYGKIHYLPDEIGRASCREQVCPYV